MSGRFAVRGRSKVVATLVMTVFVAWMVPACGGSDSADSGHGVVREDLGATAPSNAPGQQLYLERVTIDAGAQLSTHYHDGTQVAYIQSGKLTYNVVSGTLHITRASGSEETLVGPTVATLEAGDSIIETRDLVHYGANETDKPVVVLLAVLLAEDAPLATPVGG